MSDINQDFATGQTLNTMIDRELENMRRAPRPAPLQQRAEIPNGLVIERMQDAALADVIQSARERQRMAAADADRRARVEKIVSRLYGPAAQETALPPVPTERELRGA